MGLVDEQYGEQVAAFLTLREGSSQPANIEIEELVQQALGRHKTPRQIFWVGMAGSIRSLPMTASGKIQKNKLTEWGNRYLASTRSKL